MQYYEGLTYNREALLQHHQRVKRQEPPHKVLQLNFKAFQRQFHVHLEPDTEGFADNFELCEGNNYTTVDLSHMYSGYLEDEERSSCYGAVIHGQFQGSIRTANGTYHVEPLQRYTTNDSEIHSIIYHEEDIDTTPLGRDHEGFCGYDHLRNIIHDFRQEVAGQERPVIRSRRTVDDSKTTCLLHIEADHLFYKTFGSIEEVVAQVGSYVRAVNDIYDTADFEDIPLINFNVKTLNVNRNEDPSSPLSAAFIGPENLLTVFSEKNWGNYCLSYLLTNRNFKGVLGLAWEGQPGKWGGICSGYPAPIHGRNLSLNTGLVTLQKYNQRLPPWQVQLTFAHELGHSLGSPHDEGSQCGNLGAADRKGMYLMFPEATNEFRENNDKFSTCSIRRISRILREKKDLCFVVSNQPICGNQIVEDGEECDVGHNVSDPCCYSAKEPMGVQCRLKPNTLCSPSQGLCCTSDCVFKPHGATCKSESDCRMKSVCSGTSVDCPAQTAKSNMTLCSLGTRVCLHGECSKSICVIHGLEQCDCPGESMKEKCHMCCQQIDKPRTCASTTSSVLAKYFQGKRVPLVAGAPCSSNNGYCDNFQVCRLLNADGPIARLKNAFLHLDDFNDLAEWMKVYWWAILLAILTLSALMGGSVLLCGRALETDSAE
ncbi:disintegrin and metalloproteinase domain-containing protein 10 isoform X2 [Denticeps clupeoides]|uniref:disintegrin and metalloproteinase domain-containing protein 10 isoform X2 n=1 Tax=Denticeps clupeoides TaxID=299321 RepID=UPI0010A347B0|nr:disintegrin and metalloproteinase domain-containing protein 10-like isoform X2 [Denticeps clupeoides]